jgi:uncharacterized protein with NAD-binding domain and iron-sulfur cluster
MTKSPKKRIVILGGGMGAMVTAFELTSQPNWQDLYDITLYQLGWRLGGKCASGRNMTPHQFYEPDYRIQEHGFHIFFGFYANTFRVMKECYDALGNEAGTFQGIENAFQPHSFIVLEGEKKPNKWVPWNLHFPYCKNQFPWPDQDVKDVAVGSPWDYIIKLLEFMKNEHSNSSALKSLYSRSSELEPEPEPINSDLLQHIENRLKTTREELPLNWETRISKSAQDLLNLASPLSAQDLLNLASPFAKSVPNDIQNPSPKDREALIWLLDQFTKVTRHKLENVIAKLEKNFDHLLLDGYHFLILLNLGYAIARGMLVNKIFNWQSFNDLDQHDFRTWLGQNRAWTRTTNSVLVQVMYDLLFAFPDGIAKKVNGQLGAAATLRWIFRIMFTSKGAIMWKMNAGMGDTIFTPFYIELKKRGVKFEFFHRVTNLSLNPDKDAIAKVEMEQQVTLKNPKQGYNPLIPVKDLLCWPSEPLYDQIVEGEQLKEEQSDLESFWTPWPYGKKVTLNHGEDFDIVVLGISIGAFPFICQELINAKTEWQHMIKYVQTVTTQGGQLWLKPTLKELGWTEDSPVVGTYVEPLDTYADMTHLIKRENWPSDRSPKNIAYFTGVMEDPGIPDPSQYNFPAKQQQKISEQAIDWLNQKIAPLWPNATTKENPNGLNWNLLVDLEDKQGEQRFYSLFWRVNISPSERYVLSVPGSYQFRLQADTSRWDDRPRGFNNLYLTGDWVDNSFNSGCIEATTMAGMQAAKAIIKQQFSQEYHRQQIIGENDAWPKPRSLNLSLGDEG